MLERQRQQRLQSQRSTSNPYHQATEEPNFDDDEQNDEQPLTKGDFKQMARMIQSLEENVSMLHSLEENASSPRQSQKSGQRTRGKWQLQNAASKEASRHPHSNLWRVRCFSSELSYPISKNVRSNSFVWNSAALPAKIASVNL